MLKHYNLYKKIFFNNETKKPTRSWNKLFHGKGTESFKKRHKTTIDTIKEEYENPGEFIYQLEHNISERPKCIICGKEIKWNKFTYSLCCCKSCTGKYNAIERKKKTAMDTLEDNLEWTSPIDIKRYDNIIKRLFISPTGRSGKSTYYWSFCNSPKYLHKYINIKSYIKNRFNDITFGSAEVLFRLENGIEECPKCKTCGKPTKYDNDAKTYMTYCSRSCKMKDPEIQDMIRRVSMERYGSINNAKKISESHKAHNKEQIALAINRRRETNIKNGHEPNWTNTEQMIKTTYSKYGVRCSLLAPEVHKKRVDTLIKKYGVYHQSKSPIVQAKISESNIRCWKNLSQEERDKRIQIHHDWWKNLSQNERDNWSIRMKMWWLSRTEEEREELSRAFSDGQKQRYKNMSNEKRKLLGEHVKEAYANMTNEQKETIKQHKREAMLSYWGQFNEEEREKILQHNSLKSKEWWSHLSEEEKHEIYMKGWYVKCENGTLTTSEPEKRCVEYTKMLFPKTVSQEVSNVYPFHIDILIKEMNIYIEYQGTWTHGEHPYDPNNINDIAKAERWKSKGTEYYMSAYNTWTKHDHKKRQIAKKNNLRWYEVWNEKECYELIDKLYEEYCRNSK